MDPHGHGIHRSERGRGTCVFYDDSVFSCQINLCGFIGMASDYSETIIDIFISIGFLLGLHMYEFVSIYIDTHMYIYAYMSFHWKTHQPKTQDRAADGCPGEGVRRRAPSDGRVYPAGKLSWANCWVLILLQSANRFHHGLPATASHEVFHVLDRHNPSLPWGDFHHFFRYITYNVIL